MVLYWTSNLKMCRIKSICSRISQIPRATALFEPLEGRQYRIPDGLFRSRIASTGKWAVRLQKNQSNTEKHAATVVGNHYYEENAVALGRVPQVQREDVTENRCKNVENRPENRPIGNSAKATVNQLVTKQLETLSNELLEEILACRNATRKVESEWSFIALLSKFY